LTRSVHGLRSEHLSRRELVDFEHCVSEPRDCHPCYRDWCRLHHDPPSPAIRGGTKEEARAGARVSTERGDTRQSRQWPDAPPALSVRIVEGADDSAGRSRWRLDSHAVEAGGVGEPILVGHNPLEVLPEGQGCCEMPRLETAEDRWIQICRPGEVGGVERGGAICAAV